MEYSQKDRLRRLLIRCGHFMYHQTHRGGQQDAVLTLLGGGAMTQKALQEQLGIQSGSVSELVSKLECRGLIAREKDPEDRRRVILKLTEKGQGHLKFHAPRPQQALFDGLSQDECDQLAALLEKLLASWDQ